MFTLISFLLPVMLLVTASTHFQTQLLGQHFLVPLHSLSRKHSFATSSERQGPGLEGQRPSLSLYLLVAREKSITCLLLFFEIFSKPFCGSGRLKSHICNGCTTTVSMQCNRHSRKNCCMKMDPLQVCSAVLLCSFYMQHICMYFLCAWHNVRPHLHHTGTVLTTPSPARKLFRFKTIYTVPEKTIW